MAAKRSARMALRTTPEIRAAVERLAEAEGRTTAAMLERLIVEALAAREALKPRAGR